MDALNMQNFTEAMNVLDKMDVGIIIIDPHYDVRYWNPFMTTYSGLLASEAVGLPLFNVCPDLPQKWMTAKLDYVKTLKSQAFSSWEQRPHLLRFRNFQPFSGCLSLMYQNLNIFPLLNDIGDVDGLCIVITDVTDMAMSQFKLLDLMRDLETKNNEQTDLIQKLEMAQMQLLQSEKMAAIGQLAAGVAHEINNPIGFVYSNINALSTYTADLLLLIDTMASLEEYLPDDNPQKRFLQELKAKMDIDFMKEDLVNLVRESKEGIDRVKQIVQSLKDFSHVDEMHFSIADIHQGINSTLTVCNNEIKYKAKIIKEFGDIPQVECMISQINQIVMNLVVNASHAIEEQGTITIRTGTEKDGIFIEVEDTGSGIKEEHLSQIFDPFFTTKPVGKGTGLGLSLSYGIMQKHHGHISVRSELGKGTCFHIWLPELQPVQEPHQNLS